MLEKIRATRKLRQVADATAAAFQCFPTGIGSALGSPCFDLGWAYDDCILDSGD